VIQATTTKAPSEILSILKVAEKAAGRVYESTRWRPRSFDADLLFYGSQVYKTHDLEIPHPRIKERAFVLIPLSEIAPSFVDPVSHETIQRLTDLVDGKEEVKLMQNFTV
jgi:2-amino-4-hydroxy-6-hydroxymethyldihydropteridine diphosphokinase